MSEGRRVILLHQLMHCWLKEQLVPLKSSRQELGRTLLRKCYSLPLILLLLLPRLLFFCSNETSVEKLPEMRLCRGEVSS